MTLRRTAISLLVALLATAGVGAAVAGTPGTPGTGVLVELTRGPDPAAVRAAQAEVARLRSRGTDAELRVARSPSEALGAAVTLATRGAGRLVVHGVSEDAVLAPLLRARPGLQVDRLVLAE